MWSVGCMMAGMMLDREPFFKGADNLDMVLKIAKVVGTEDILSYVKKFRLTLNSYYDDKLLQ